MVWKTILVDSRNLKNFSIEVNCEDAEPVDDRIRASHGKGGPHVGVVDDGWLVWRPRPPYGKGCSAIENNATDDLLRKLAKEQFAKEKAEWEESREKLFK